MFFTNLMKDLNKGRRIRTQDYHGSLKATFIGKVAKSEFSFKRTGDPLILCPIGISAQVYQYVVSLTLANDASKGDTALNIYWKNDDGTYEECGQLDADCIVQQQNPGAQIRYIQEPKVLWEYIGPDNHPSWREHLQDKYLYLGLKVRNANTSNDPELGFMQFFYVDGAPSDTPFDKKSVGWKGDNK